ncbi:glycerol-3-phosphate cytidylyltransferase [Lactobacillaceae bacterium Melli_B4]
MKKVITYGTFDLLHKGHVRLLKRARELGDYLMVGLSSDEFNAEKGKKAYTSYEDRKYVLESIRYVDKVIPEKGWNQKINDVKENDIDVFVMGDDWKGEFDFLKDYCEVVYLPRTEGISTTKIKQDLGIKDSDNWKV